MAQQTRLIPKYNTNTFREIFKTVDQWKSDCKASGLLTLKSEIVPEVNGQGETVNKTVITYYLSDMNLERLYHLLWARHANDPIKNWDKEQFKYKVYSIIFKYGPTWQKRLELQDEARALTIDQAAAGTTSIYNHAFNDASETQTAQDIDGQLRFVNDQNVSKFKKGKTDTIMNLWEILKVDITDSFLNKFDNLFDVIGDTDPYLYITEEV